MRNKRFAKARAVLKGTRGETLMEGIISILIFTILLTSVTMMIMVSLRITAHATGKALDMQENANIAAEQKGSNSGKVIVFSFTDAEGTEIKFPVTVNITDEDDFEDDYFTAFAP